MHLERNRGAVRAAEWPVTPGLALTVAFVAGLLAAPVHAQDASEAEDDPPVAIEDVRERALDALQSGDLPAAAAIFQELGDSGVPQGYTMLGEIKRDIGDHADAARWFEKASEGGDVMAMLQGADLLSDPEFGLNDARRAFRLWRSAAEQGSARAQYEAAKALLEGTGTRRDAAAGAELMEQAARQCIGEAQLEYGKVLRAGTGREADGAEALAWIISAERSSDDWSATELTELETLQNEIPAYMSTAQVTAAYCRGLEVHAETCGSDGVLFRLERWLACDRTPGEGAERG